MAVSIVLGQNLDGNFSPDSARDFNPCRKHIYGERSASQLTHFRHVFRRTAPRLPEDRRLNGRALRMSELLETCELAARAGADELLAWRGRFETHEKAPADLVTDADLASQTAIRREIALRFPHHLFLGEEQTSRPQAGDDDYVWLVDPLDGTTNYVHGYPLYAVSVAVAQGSRLQAGVIYDPLADELYRAERGGGAYCNDVPLHTSRAQKAGEALIAVSLPPKVAADSPDLADLVRIIQHCQAVRRSGSAALNLAYVAQGRLDAFWATKIQPWDVAAGALLVLEAGGVVTGRDGGEFDLWNPHFLSANNRQLHVDLLSLLGPGQG
jgi:myo-inositol-1(or 4)-monophosphatase